MILCEAPPTAGLPLSLGDLVFRSGPASFARTIRDLTGAPDVLITCSGTAALVVVFFYLKANSRRRTVVISAYTCPLVALAALHVGLNVVLCDTIPGGFELDADHLAKLVDHDTLCVVPTHYGGALTDIARIRRVVEGPSTGTFIVEDAAQAFGATLWGESVGLGGDVGIFSFSAGKGLSIFEGGCIVSRDRSLMTALRKINDEVVPTNRILEIRRMADVMCHYLLYNSFGTAVTYGARRRYWLRRDDAMRATNDYYSSNIPLHKIGSWRMSVGAGASRRLSSHLARIREIFAELGEQLHGLPGIKTHDPQQGSRPSCTYRFLTFNSEAYCKEVLGALWPLPFGVSKPYLCATGDHPCLVGKLVASKTPNARELAAQTIALTTSPILRESSRRMLVETFQGLVTAR